MARADTDAKAPTPSGAPTGPPPGLWTPRAALRSLGRPEITRMVLFIYLPLLIPVTVGAALVARHIDRWLGWPPLPGWPWNVILFGVLTLKGLFVVGWCYSYLILVGGGGPAPLVAPGATILVKDGPYRLSRHPSVWGKLLGVLGLGFLMRSPFFLCVLCPLALAGSLLEKWFFMEKREVAHWGDEYRAYQRAVPFFVPRLRDLAALLHRRLKS